MRYIVSLRRGILWLTPFNGIRFHRLTCARYRKRIVLHNATRLGLRSPDGEWVTIGGKVKVLNPKKAKPIWTARTDNTGLLTRSGQQGGVRVLGVEKEGVTASSLFGQELAPHAVLVQWGRDKRVPDQGSFSRSVRASQPRVPSLHSHSSIHFLLHSSSQRV
ncbi:hypothetical protein VNO80_33874 [Phaseolus coccineus]|uniref:Uncharacterized protein n=1 Tax=Phaseolus coccineus TaxID=3886 RepID=A0AAN9L121_PHACN